MKETRILVTGGAGFLGSHLCDRLVEIIVQYSEDVPQSDDITVLTLKKLL